MCPQGKTGLPVGVSTPCPTPESSPSIRTNASQVGPATHPTLEMRKLSQSKLLPPRLTMGEAARAPGPISHHRVLCPHGGLALFPDPHRNTGWCPRGDQSGIPAPGPALATPQNPSRQQLQPRRSFSHRCPSSPLGRKAVSANSLGPWQPFGEQNATWKARRKSSENRPLVETGLCMDGVFKGLRKQVGAQTHSFQERPLRVSPT